MHDDCEPCDKPPGSVLGLDPETEALCRAVRDRRIVDTRRVEAIMRGVSAEIKRMRRKSPAAASWIQRQLREGRY
jgi:hypothetical protein